MLSEISKHKPAQIILLHFLKISSIDTCTETEGSLLGLGMESNEKDWLMQLWSAFCVTMMAVSLLIVLNTTELYSLKC